MHRPEVAPVTPAIQRRLALATMLLALGLAVLSTPVYRFTGDTQYYVGLARALAHGQAYSMDGRPELQFPPGYPLLLAPAAWLFHDSFAAISRWSSLLSSLVFPLTWLYLRRREPALALPVALLTVFSVNFLSYATDNPMAEPVYLAATMGLLIWSDRRWDEEARGVPWGRVLVGCVLCVLVPAIRTIGIAGVVASGLMLLFARGVPTGRRRAYLIYYGLPFAAGMIFLAAWFVRVKLVAWGWYPGNVQSGYLGHILAADPHNPDLGHASLLQLLDRGLSNFLAQAIHSGEILTPIPWFNPVWYSPVLLATPCIIAGWWRGLREEGRFAALYFFCYMGILLAWPYDEGPRFLLPLAPLLLLYFLSGLRTLLGALRSGRSWPRIAGIGYGVAAIMGILLSGKGLAGLSRQDQATLAGALVLLVALMIGWKWILRLARWTEPPRERWIGWAALCILVALTLVEVGPTMVKRSRGGPPESENARALWEAAAWLDHNAGPDDVIQSTFQSRIQFATGRPGVPFPVTERPEPFLEIERRYRPRFLIVLDSEDPYYLPIERTRFALLEGLFPGHWRSVHHFQGGTIYASR